jgi:PAS domain S-box-containing protein
MESKKTFGDDRNDQRGLKIFTKNNHLCFHLLNTVGQSVIATDLEGTVIYCNRAAEALYGWPNGELLGRNILDIIPLPSIEEAKAIMTRLSEGESWTGKFLVQRKDGSSFYAMVTDSPVLDENGNFIAIVGVSWDITNYHKTETDYKKQNIFLNSIIESLTHPFFVIDVNNYTVEIANSAAVGDNASPSTPITCYRLTHQRESPCDTPNHRCPVSAIKESKKPFMTEHIHYDREGKKIYTEIYGYPLFNEKGDVEKVIEYSLDITKRKLAEQKLKASLEEKEVLLKEIHHRVKNNLQIINSLLNLQILQTQNSHTTNIFREIQNRIFSIALVHEKLYMSENFSEIEFNEYVEKMVGHLHNAFQLSSRVTVELNINSVHLDIATAIPCGLILNELVTNALKHAFPGNRKGRIRISFKKSGVSNESNYLLTVKDDGIGMPEHITLDNTDSLGLQLVKILASQLDGTVSLLRNKGTQINITIRG